MNKILTIIMQVKQFYTRSHYSYTATEQAVHYLLTSYNLYMSPYVT